MKKQFFLILIFLFLFSSICFSATLTNEIIEPVEPVQGGQNFTLRVKALVDSNSLSDYENAPNGSFESGTTPPNSTTLWTIELNNCAGSSPLREFQLCSVEGYTGCDSLHGAFVERRNTSSPVNFRWYICGVGSISCGFSPSSNNNITEEIANGSCVEISPAIALNSYDLNNFDGNVSGGDFQIIQTDSQTIANTVAYIAQFFNSAFDTSAATRLRALIGSQRRNVLLTDQNVLVDFVRIATLAVNSDYVDADCNTSFNNSAFLPMTFSSANEWDEINFTAPNFSGDFNYAISCRYTTVSDGVVSDYDQGFISVRVPEFSYLTITPIENIASYSFSSVDFFPQDESAQIIWRVDSNSATSVTPEFKIFNSLTDGRQYFIYTATELQFDAGTWVFDDTLTFGSENDTPIQKIWSEIDERYTYSFTDTLEPVETKYYKLTYRNPFKQWYSIASESEWLKNLQPTVIDVNVIDVDEYSISNFSNIRNIYTIPVPDVTEDVSYAFELQFTAWSDVNQTVIYGGQTVNGDFSNDIATSATLTDTPHRYSFGIDAFGFFDAQALIKTANTTGATVYITDYALVPRGYFTDRLEILKSDGDALDAILLGGFSNQYLQEGEKFRITSKAYDREGKLETLVIEGYFSSVTPSNKVKTQTTALYVEAGESIDAENRPETVFDFANTFDPIIDLNGNAFNPATPRNLFIKAKLVDDENVVVAVQSRSVKFIQFPYFPSDLTMSFIATEKRKGKNPAGLLSVQIAKPDILTGFDIRIYSDQNTFANPNYRTVIYEGQDFDCVGAFCNLQIKIDDFVFEDVNLTRITIVALLNTEYEDATNTLTTITTNIFVTPIEFTTARIQEIFHRLDRTYSNTEEIQLVLSLRSSDAENLKNRIDVNLTVQLCDANVSGTCNAQQLVYRPTGFAYDELSNTNFYFFRYLFITDNGTILPDGNYIGFHATITDKSGASAQIIPVLADPCKNNLIDVSTFFGNSFLASAYNYSADLLGLPTQINVGCITGEDQFAIVTTTTNNAQESRLLIDTGLSPSSPQQNALICRAPDLNNIIENPLEQDVDCIVIYKVGQQPIDNFRFRVTNQFSDTSIDGISKQYKEYNIPYQVIAMADLSLLKAQLQANKNVVLTTLGDFVYEFFNQGFSSNFATNLSSVNKNTFLNSGLLQGVGADFNLDSPFAPQTLTGAYGITIHGFPHINMQNYRNDSKISEDFDKINPRRFIEYAKSNNVRLPEEKSNVTVTLSLFNLALNNLFNTNFGTGNVLTIEDNEGLFVINELPSQKINALATQDQNSLTNSTRFDFIPKQLFFTINSTMFFANQSQNSSLAVVISFFDIIRDSFANSIIDFFNGVSNGNEIDPAGSIVDSIYKNIILIAVILGLLFVIAVIYNQFNGGNN